MKTKTFLAVSAAVVALFWGAAPLSLAAQSAESVPSAQAAAADANAASEFVTVFGTMRKPQLDPQAATFSMEAQIMTAVYEGLFCYDPQSLEPVPAVAESWTKSAQGTVYTFKLRKNAKWSDGSALIASDFKNAWIRLLAANANYASFLDPILGAQDFRTGKTFDASQVQIKTPDDTTLEVQLSSPIAYFTRLLCHHAFVPVHPSMLDKGDWSAQDKLPVNGPYRFSSQTDDSISAEKNPFYWDKDNVAIASLKFLFNDDELAATQLFDNGEVHWLDGSVDLASLLSYDAIQHNPMFSTNYWIFDAHSPGWDDARVRRALALLLPWPQLRSKTNYDMPASTLVLPLPGYSDVKGIEKTNKTEAMKLLAQAGYPEGAGLPEMRIMFIQYKDSTRVTDLMKSAWEKALPGFKVSLVPTAPDLYYDNMAKGPEKGGFTLINSTWIGDFADPMAFLQMFTAGSALNIGGYANSDYDELLAESQTQEGKDRMSTMAKAEELLLREAAVLPMFHSFATSIIDTDYIEGWYPNALDIHPYKALRFGEPSFMPNVAYAY